MEKVTLRVPITVVGGLLLHEVKEILGSKKLVSFS